MKYTLLPAILVLAMLQGGCASLTSPGRSQALESDKPYWFDYGSERRGALLVPQKSGGILMCSEPVPRVTATLAAEGKGKASGQAGAPGAAAKGEAEAEGKVKSGASAVNDEVMVLFLREALYRLCEMSVNLGSVEKDYKEPVLKLYASVIDAAVNLSGKNDSQIRARTLEKYIDVLAQYQKASTDATTASSQYAQELKAQVEALKSALSQSLNEIKADIASMKSAPLKPAVTSPVSTTTCVDEKC